MYSSGQFLIEKRTHICDSVFISVVGVLYASRFPDKLSCILLLSELVKKKAGARETLLFDDVVIHFSLDDLQLGSMKRLCAMSLPQQAMTGELIERPEHAQLLINEAIAVLELERKERSHHGDNVCMGEGDHYAACHVARVAITDSEVASIH